MTASFHCCGKFSSRQISVVSRWSSKRVVRSSESPSIAVPWEGHPPTLFSRLSLPLYLWQPSPPWDRSQGHPRRVTAGAYWGCWDLAWRISSSAANLSRTLPLYLAAASLPRQERTELLPSKFLPAVSIV